MDISALVRNVREQLEDSTIPFRFDVVDMGFASEILKQRIRREGILWKNSGTIRTRSESFEQTP